MWFMKCKLVDIHTIGVPFFNIKQKSMALGNTLKSYETKWSVNSVNWILFILVFNSHAHRQSWDFGLDNIQLYVQTFFFFFTSCIAGAHLGGIRVRKLTANFIFWVNIRLDHLNTCVTDWVLKVSPPPFSEPLIYTNVSVM